MGTLPGDDGIRPGMPSGSVETRGGEAVRCSPWTRDAGVDPIGSAGVYRSFLLVEWPLPWPADLAEVPAFGRLGPELEARRCRLQGVVCEGDAPERRVALYSFAGERFAGFECQEVTVAPAGVVTAALDLLGGGGPPAGRRQETEVLVCGHGRRDRCCGSMGTRLVQDLLDDPGRLGEGVRVGRTSHTGGHRFAPTAIVLPTGTLWAFADRDLLARVVNRQGAVSEVLGRYRGCAALSSPRMQVLEREVLAEIGWDLFDRPRWGEEGTDGGVRLHVEGDGVTDTWQAVIEEGRVTPVPVCGEPLTQARKTNTEYVVRHFTRS